MNSLVCVHSCKIFVLICLFSDMRNTFIVSNMFIACSVVSPILWHLWIYAGSANANFYFAIALTFSTAQVSVPYLVASLDIRW